MKILLSILFISLAVSLLFTGCIEVKTLVKVNNDGTGTIEETVIMSKEIIEMINEFTTAFASDSVNTEKFELFDEEKLRNQASNFGEGVTYLSGNKIAEDGREGFTSLYSFNNINKIQIDQNPGRKIPLLEEEGGTTDSEFLGFTFNEGNPSELTIHMPEMETDNEEEELDDSVEVIPQDSLSKNQEFEEAKRFLKDLRITLAINVEGNIVETNAQNVNGSEVTLFQIDFNELLDSEDKWNMFMEKDPQTFEEVKEIIKDLPGIKVELNDPVFIKFN
jgi:hypothetical protein